MELIKELPEVFEEFAEQRQKSFLAMKGLKDQEFRLLAHIVLIFRQRSQEQWEQLQSAYALYPMRQSRTQRKTCQRTYVH